MDIIGFSKLYLYANRANNNKNIEVNEPVEIPAFSACPIIKGNNKNAGMYLAAYQMLLYEQRRRPKADSGVCIVSFPVTCRDDILGKQVGDIIISKNHSRNRKLLEETGVIWLYQKGDRNKNLCDRFYWSIENEQKFINHCKNYFTEEQLTYIPKEEDCKLIEINELDTLLYTWPSLPKEVNIGKKYKCPDGMNKELFKKYLLTRFIDDNKLYNVFNDILKSTPSVLDNKYFPKVKEEKKRFHISLRQTNDKCNLPTNEKEHDSVISYYREDYNKENGYNLYGDVKSSVPRVLDRLYNGSVVSFDYDYYRAIYNNWVSVLKDEISYGLNVSLDTITTQAAWKNVRNFIKTFCLPAIFSVSGENFSKDVVYRIEKSRYYLANKKHLYVPQTNSLESWKPYLESLWQAVHEILPVIPNGDASIFMHESNIMILVNKWLTDLGYETWLCYDAIYAKKDGITQEQFSQLFQQLYSNALEEYSNILWYDDYSLLHINVN